MSRFPRDIWLKLNGSDFRILEELSYQLKNKDWILLDRRFLAKRVGISIDQVSRVTSHLQELGLLRKFQRKFRREDGTYETYPCLYRLVPWMRWKIEKGGFPRPWIKDMRKVCESPIEEKFWTAASPRLKTLERQYDFPPYRLDFVLASHKIAIELDGHQFHRSQKNREEDAKRDRFLLQHGWRTLRFTGSEIYNDVDQCITEIESVLEKTGPVFH